MFTQHFVDFYTWWRHQMETYSASLAFCGAEFTGEFQAQRPVMRSFDVFFDLSLNKRLSKQSRRRWFETPSRSLWRHCNYKCMLWYLCNKHTWREWSTVYQRIWQWNRCAPLNTLATDTKHKIKRKRTCRSTNDIFISCIKSVAWTGVAM